MYYLFLKHLDSEIIKLFAISFILNDIKKQIYYLNLNLFPKKKGN